MPINLKSIRITISYLVIILNQVHENWLLMIVVPPQNNCDFPILRILGCRVWPFEAIGDTAQFESLRGICAHYRWGLTGTPPTRDLAQVATLAQVFHLGELPVEKDDSYSTDLAQDMAQHFLDHFARQNTSEEIEAIDLKEHIITVDQTAEERVIYLQASRDVADNSGSAFSSEDRAERLIKLCSHFAAYCGMAAAASDAGSECHRIISTKEDHAKKSWKEVLQRAVQLKLLNGTRSAQQEILQRLGADPSECANLTTSLVPELGNQVMQVAQPEDQSMGTAAAISSCSLQQPEPAESSTCTDRDDRDNHVHPKDLHQSSFSSTVSPLNFWGQLGSSICWGKMPFKHRALSLLVRYDYHWLASIISIWGINGSCCLYRSLPDVFATVAAHGRPQISGAWSWPFHCNASRHSMAPEIQTEKSLRSGSSAWN